MNSELLIPNTDNFSAIFNDEGYAMVTCMGSCRGCQCRVNPFNSEDIFEEELWYAPNESQYLSILAPVNSKPMFSSGGCPCNCTSCNSCRCDCRVGRDFFEELDAVWA